VTTDLSTVQRENDKLSAEMAAAETRAERAQADVHQLKQDSNASKQELNRLKMEISRYKHDLEEQVNKVVSLQEEISQLLREKDERSGSEASRLREFENEKRRMEERAQYRQRDGDEKAAQLSRLSEEKYSLDHRYVQVRTVVSANVIVNNSVGIVVSQAGSRTERKFIQAADLGTAGAGSECIEEE
jgi:chromosome segregation ATPase